MKASGQRRGRAPFGCGSRQERWAPRLASRSFSLRTPSASARTGSLNEIAGGVTCPRRLPQPYASTALSSPQAPDQPLPHRHCRGLSSERKRYLVPRLTDHTSAEQSASAAPLALLNPDATSWTALSQPTTVAAVASRLHNQAFQWRCPVSGEDPLYTSRRGRLPQLSGTATGRGASRKLLHRDEKEMDRLDFRHRGVLP